MTHILRVLHQRLRDCVDGDAGLATTVPRRPAGTQAAGLTAHCLPRLGTLPLWGGPGSDYRPVVAKAGVTSHVAGFYQSLHLNLGESYRKLGDLDPFSAPLGIVSVV